MERGRPRLWRGLPLAAALALALAAGGCSLSSQFDSLFGGGDKSDTTGSITPPPGTKEASELPPDADLALCARRRQRGAQPRRQGRQPAVGKSATGARGTVTPIASAYTQDGHTCRDFLASYVNGSIAVLAAGRGLQAAQGRLGSAHAQALEALVSLRAVPRRALHPGAIGTPH